jgi:putrescine transport system substrate-binding protein
MVKVHGTSVHSGATMMVTPKIPTRAGRLARGAVMMVAAGALALGLAACNTGGGEKKDGAAGGTLNLFIWNDYIDPALVEEFTKETGITVVSANYDSNESMETPLMTGGSGYDLAVPSNHSVERLIVAGALQEIDRSKLTNYQNLWPYVNQKMETYDPGLKYSVPYMWGTVGIGYNVDAVAKRLPGETVGWQTVLDPAKLAKFKDCGVLFLDSAEDMFPPILAYLGKDPNSKNAEDFKAAADHLLKLRGSVRKFDTAGQIDGLATGDVCITVGYSGDTLQAKTKGAEGKPAVNVDYALPAAGGQLWFDNMVIPKGAANAEAAHKFLDFLLRPDIAARNTNYIQYANANLASQGQIDQAIRGNPNVYPTEELREKLYLVTKKDPELQRRVTREWQRVKTGI